MEDIGGKWIWAVLLLAYYVYSAYAANKKKQAEANKKMPQNTEAPKRHYNPTPTSQPLPKPMGDIFRELFGEENIPTPKPKPAEIKRKQPTIKQVVEAKKDVPLSVPFTASETAMSQDQKEIKKQEKAAYKISKPGESRSFNAREAFIGSIIFNRPEY